MEESSEIASARASSIYRKSFHKKGPKKTLVNKYKKQTSLSKISEEDSENIASKSDNQATRNVEDKEMFSDKAITNSTSGNSNSNTDNENDMKAELGTGIFELEILTTLSAIIVSNTVLQIYTFLDIVTAI